MKKQNERRSQIQESKVCTLSPQVLKSRYEVTKSFFSYSKFSCVLVCSEQSRSVKCILLSNGIHPKID